jgi:hypothetical protein
MCPNFFFVENKKCPTLLDQISVKKERLKNVLGTDKQGKKK